MAAYPPGHFYSPVVDLAELQGRRDIIWPAETPEIPGVDFRLEAQCDLLKKLTPLIREFDLPRSEDRSADPPRFFIDNPNFSWLDARFWFAFLRHQRPGRVIEVGGGYTTLLATEVNRRFLGGETFISSIEPFPPKFLKDGLPGLGELIVKRVQDVPLSFFQQLQAGDVLFIDSSHVSKTGSDVNYLYLEVLPQLAPGVLIHCHDIFLPHEYPENWVLGDERSWNEQYILQALLTFSQGFEVLFGCAYMFYHQPELVREAVGELYGGGSFWMRRIGSTA